MRRVIVALCLLFAALARPASAHELRSSYLELRQTGPETYDVLFKVPGGGENVRLGLYAELPADCVKLTATRSSFVNDAFTERYRVKRKGGLGGGTINIAGLAASTTDVLVRLQQLDGRSQVVRLTPDAPSFVVPAAPDGWRVAATYFRMGVEHILFGVDHLLFVLGLLLLVSNRWMLLKTITSFTIAHSLTLAVATLGYASAPVPPVEAAIALSILLLGPEIVRYQRGETSLTIRHPWVVAFAFGLLHGFGFASGLTMIGLPGGDIPIALLFFNVGVEAGQLGFVALVVLPKWTFRALGIRWPRAVEVAAGYAVGSLGAFWTIQRTWMMFGAPR
jgi:hydrogenase/urease accessory protein HupE